MKNKNSSNFTRDANWPPNHKTYFGFALPCLWNVIIHFLIWCGWLGSGQIGRFLTGIITFHRPGRAKCKKCFVVRESMCISGEIRGIFGFSKRNLVSTEQYYLKEKVPCHQHVVRKCLAFKECITIDTCQLFTQNKAVNSNICIIELESTTF